MDKKEFIDLDDILTDEETEKKVLEQTKDSLKNSFRHITYSEKIKKARAELQGTNPNEVIKWGWSAWDKALGWIYWGKIYSVWWESWWGKSTFINQLSHNLSKQWVKVTKYSLEDRMEDIWKEELYYICNRIKFECWESWYEWAKFLNNEYWTKWSMSYDKNFDHYLDLATDRLAKLKITELDKTRKVKIEELIKLMEQEAENWTKVFIIDHLHYFEMWWDRVDLQIENVMHNINEIARKYNVAIFVVAHYRKLNKTTPDNDSFKDASAIKQTANIIIHIIRDFDSWTTDFILGKIRWPIQCRWFSAKFNINTFTYENMEEILYFNK